MHWLEAGLVDIGLARRLLGLENEISRFIHSNSGKWFVSDSIDFWREERKIILPFRTGLKGFVSLDLSFLLGVANRLSMNIVSACKKDSRQKRGYDLLGFRFDDDELTEVQKQDFCGFGSKNWRILKIGDDGYTAYVHVQGTLSIWRFYIEEDGGKLILRRRAIFSSSDKNIFSSVERLKKEIKRRSEIDQDDIDVMAVSIYNCFRGMQGVLISKDDAAC